MTSTPRPSDDDRLEELLAELAIQGLSPDEQAELDRLLAAADSREGLAYEAAAAAIELAFEPTEFPPLPTALARKIALDARRHLPGASVATKSSTVVGTKPRVGSPSTRDLRRALRDAGWLAAAACLLIAVVAWMNPRSTTTAVVDHAQGRQDLLKLAGDVIVIPWTRGADPSGKTASGDVVWSNARQQGYLRFRGLAPNDPAKSQYQLWIFDAKRDERYPVDGGLFNVAGASGDVIVPIDARLRVQNPTLFAITVEPPGGVVVSSRERLPLLATVPAPKT